MPELNPPTVLDATMVRVGRDVCPSPHSFGNKAGRVLWGLIYWTAFRYSPRVLHGWRRLVLRCLGARVGKAARIDPSVRIWAPWNLRLSEESAVGHHVDLYNVAEISIGAHATVSQYAFLCTATHDVTDPHMRLVSRPIHVDDQTWICAGAFVAPGVRVGTGSVAAACSVVTKDVPQWTIVAGNPAHFLKPRLLNFRP